MEAKRATPPAKSSSRTILVGTTFVALALLVVLSFSACTDSPSSFSGPPSVADMDTSSAESGPPSLQSNGTWFNVDGPLTLADLQGKTVWLEFGFLH